MTYRELATLIAAMSEEQKDQSVTIFDSAENEYYPATRLLFAGEENGVLDEDHGYIEF